MESVRDQQINNLTERVKQLESELVTIKSFININLVQLKMETCKFLEKLSLDRKNNTINSNIINDDGANEIISTIKSKTSEEESSEFDDNIPIPISTGCISLCNKSISNTISINTNKNEVDELINNKGKKTTAGSKKKPEIKQPKEENKEEADAADEEEGKTNKNIQKAYPIYSTYKKRVEESDSVDQLIKIAIEAEKNNEDLKQQLLLDLNMDPVKFFKKYILLLFETEINNPELKEKYTSNEVIIPGFVDKTKKKLITSVLKVKMTITKILLQHYTPKTITKLALKIQEDKKKGSKQKV